MGLRGQNQNNSFIIVRCMLGENNGAPLAEALVGEAEGEQSFDFSDCQRLKKLTTHDIYRFSRHGQSLLVKLFAPQALANYQQELSCLRCAQHPALLKVLHHRPAQDPNSPDPLERSHLIVMGEASRGDLNDYLPRFGKMGEKIARSYFRQLVEALQGLSEQQPPLLHPSLQPSSVLIANDGQLRLCGWSEVSSRSGEERIREGVFSCGEILVCMLTTAMPFYKKNSPTDTYYKFLSQEHIHKFWQEMQKKIQKTDKKFSFSPEVKDLLEGIFLKKINKFSQLAAHHWTRGEVYSPEELLRLLEDNQKAKNEKLAARRKQMAAKDEQRRKAVHDYQISYGMNRSSNDSHQEFIKDCEENTIRQEDLPVKDCLGSLRVEGEPAFAIASLKEFFRSEKGKSSVVLCQQFVLAEHRLVRVNNCARVQLQFCVAGLQQEQEDLLQPQLEQQRVVLSLKISFSRHGKEIFADTQVEQSDFNAYYTNLALTFIEEKIHKSREDLQ